MVEWQRTCRLRGCSLGPVRKTGMAEFGNRLISLRTELTNTLIVNYPSWHLRDYLVDSLVLAVVAVALRGDCGAVATQAHAG